MLNGRALLVPFADLVLELSVGSLQRAHLVQVGGQSVVQVLHGELLTLRHSVQGKAGTFKQVADGAMMSHEVMVKKMAMIIVVLIMMVRRHTHAPATRATVHAGRAHAGDALDMPAPAQRQRGGGEAAGATGSEAFHRHAAHLCPEGSSALSQSYGELNRALKSDAYELLYLFIYPINGGVTLFTHYTWTGLASGHTGASRALSCSGVSGGRGQ